MRWAWWRLLVPSLAVLLLACAERAPAPSAEPELPGFSGERAFGHLARLVAIGPRVSGTRGAEEARTYLREQLQALGLEVSEQVAALGEGAAAATYTNLVAALPGESSDLVVLAAPYDSRPFESFRFVGANEGASGAALLLELARVLKEQPLPYTVWFGFLEGDSQPRSSSEPEPALNGSQVLVATLQEAGRLPAVRAAVYFDRVADSDLSIARDLQSYRRYRIDFFEAARLLGHSDAFPPDADATSVEGAHTVFFRAGMRRALAVVDDRFGGAEPPGLLSHTEQDDLEHCSAASLGAVGQVSEAALRAISRRLRKIDRFARTPTAADPAASATEAPEAPEAPEAGSGGGQGASGAGGAQEQAAPFEAEGVSREPAAPPGAEGAKSAPEPVSVPEEAAEGEAKPSEAGGAPASPRCGERGDPGNALGVGRYCDQAQDCLSTAPYCTALASPGLHFCSTGCDPGGDAATQCGEAAVCVCGSAGRCGCTPVACAGGR